MKNDQEKISYPNIQLSTMFELNLKCDQKHLLFDLNGIKSNSIQILLQL